MKNNIVAWANNYSEYLLKYYDEITLYFMQYNHPVPTYKEFVIYVYGNTKKRYDLRSKKLIAPVY